MKKSASKPTARPRASKPRAGTVIKVKHMTFPSNVRPDVVATFPNGEKWIVEVKHSSSQPSSPLCRKVWKQVEKMGFRAVYASLGKNKVVYKSALTGENSETTSGGRVMSTLDERYRVAKDLLAQGATSVNIAPRRLSVSKQPHGVATNAQPNASSINIQTIVTQSQSLTVDLGASIDELLSRVDSLSLGPDEAKEARAQLAQLKTEAASPSPKWEKVKLGLRWLLEFGRDTFVQLAPVILQALIGKPPLPS